METTTVTRSAASVHTFGVILPAVGRLRHVGLAVNNQPRRVWAGVGAEYDGFEGHAGDRRGTALG